MPKMIKSLSLTGAVFFSIFLANAAFSESSTQERVFTIEERILFKGLPQDISALRIWVPYPVEDSQQTIEDLKLEGPFDFQIITDSEYNNRILYLKPKELTPHSDSAQVILSFKVQRREYAMPYAEIPHGKALARFLKADRLVPVNGRIRQLAKEITKGKKDGLEKVRALYDYIINELTYSKDDPKVCGIGDSLLTLEHKKGICTDYHSLFISLVRSLGIPAKFEIGFRIPTDAQEGKLNGYHCWAKFYLLPKAPACRLGRDSSTAKKDKGWIPVDISEADKHPEKKDYFFGHIDENRVHLTTGRDIRLSYAKEREPLNFFVYPYVQLNGERYDALETNIFFKQKDKTENY